MPHGLVDMLEDDSVHPLVGVSKRPESSGPVGSARGRMSETDRASGTLVSETNHCETPAGVDRSANPQPGPFPSRSTATIAAATDAASSRNSNQMIANSDGEPQIGNQSDASATTEPRARDEEQ